MRGPLPPAPRRLSPITLPPRALLLVLLLPALSLTSCTLVRSVLPPRPATDPVSASVPADFRLEVRCAGARNPHCDYRLVVTGDGAVSYDVSHHGARPADRRGGTRLKDGGLRALWESVNGADFQSLPARIAPTPDGSEQGELTIDVAGGRRDVRVVVDHARHRSTDHLLSVLYYYVPQEVFRVP